MASDLSVYSRMTDQELEYSLERAEDRLRDITSAFMAAELLENTSESAYFDRIVLDYDSGVKEEVEDRLDSIAEEHECLLEEARKAERGIDEKRYDLDFDSLTSELAENLQNISFDRVGISGIARGPIQKSN